MREEFRLIEKSDLLKTHSEMLIIGNQYNIIYIHTKKNIYNILLLRYMNLVERRVGHPVTSLKGGRPRRLR